MLEGILNIIGAYVRFVLYNGFQRVLGRKQRRTLDHFLKDKKGQMIRNVNNDYANGIVGFLSFGLVLFLAYLLFG